MNLLPFPSTLLPLTCSLLVVSLAPKPESPSTLNENNDTFLSAITPVGRYGKVLTEDTSVPINMAYNHHHDLSLVGAGSRMERVPYV